MFDAAQVDSLAERATTALGGIAHLHSDNPDALHLDENAERFVREFFDHDNLVGGICMHPGS